MKSVITGLGLMLSGMSAVATRLLRKLVDNGSLSARYNLARLYQKRGRDADATSPSG